MPNRFNVIYSKATKLTESSPLTVISSLLYSVSLSQWHSYSNPTLLGSFSASFRNNKQSLDGTLASSSSNLFYWTLQRLLLGRCTAKSKWQFVFRFIFKLTSLGLIIWLRYSQLPYPDFFKYLALQTRISSGVIILFIFEALFSA